VSHCNTVTRTRSAASLRGATRSGRGQVDTQDQTPFSTKADPLDMFFSLLVVVRLDGVSMRTDPPRPALFLYVAGHEWEGHSFPIARLRLFHQPAQLASPSNSLHSAAMAFDASTNQHIQASGSHHTIFSNVALGLQRRPSKKRPTEFSWLEGIPSPEFIDVLLRPARRSKFQQDVTDTPTVPSRHPSHRPGQFFSAWQGASRKMQRMPHKQQHKDMRYTLGRRQPSMAAAGGSHHVRDQFSVSTPK
jgi:hypothetical protein